MSDKEWRDLDQQWENRSLKAYSTFTEHPGRTVLVWGSVFVALCVAIWFIGWQASWWMSDQNTNRQDHQIRRSYGNQATLRDQISSNMTVVFSLTSQVQTDPGAAVALKAQRASVVNTICADAAQITDGFAAGQAAFIKHNCNAGAMSPSSPYYVR